MPWATLNGLGFELDTDFFQLMVHTIVVIRHTINMRHGLLGFIDFAFAIVVSRRFGKEYDTYTEDGSEDEGETHSDLP